MTVSCPQCEADMELLTTDDDGEIVVYECPDCGSQLEAPIQDGDLGDDHELPASPDVDDTEVESEDDAS